MQREEKQQEAILQAILNRVNDLKTAIQALITKLETEYETINWPTFLDNYAILSGHVSNLMLTYSYAISKPTCFLSTNLICTLTANRAE